MTWNRGRWTALLLAGLVQSSVGCLLYSNPVNTPPTVTITAPQTFALGDNDFRADARDDNPGSLRYDWGAVQGVCPAGNALPTGMRVASGDAASFTFTVNARGDYCVFVTVTDDQGAADHVTTGFKISDQAPTAKITRVSARTTALPVDARTPLYSALRFTSSGSSDPDPMDSNGPLPSSWTLTPPGGHAATAPPCADVAADVCFTVDTPGTWTLALTVADGDRMTAQDTLMIDVAPDQAPCITETDPPFSIEGLVRDEAHLTFTVSEVEDDGDPLPAPLDRASMSSFSWSWRLVGAAAFTRVVVPDLPTFSFPPGVFGSGQVIQVRVDARDRRASQAELASCDASSGGELLCVVRPGCDQRVTWTVEVL